MYQIISFVSTILLVVLILLLFKNKTNKSFSTTLKILTIIYCAMGFFRFMLSDAFVLVINGGYNNGIWYESKDILQSILRWGYYTSYAVVPMAVFFENRLFRNFSSYICLPFAILSVVFMGDFMEYFLSPKGYGIKLDAWMRYAYFIAELVLVMVIEILIQIKYKHVFNVKDKKEWFNFLVALPLILLQVMPVYLPQSIFGYTKISIHKPWLIIIAIETIVLYYYFRFKDYNTRYQLVIFLTIVLFFHYDSLYLMGFSIRRLPVQLCNLASYLYMIALIFKRQKLFNFCCTVNIVGTLIAILAPDFSGGSLGFWNMHYTFEHMLVFIVPVLAMGLRLFKRIDRSAIKHMLVGFAVYFSFCLISGILLNAYVTDEYTSVNYFYLFDLDKAIDYVSFIKYANRLPIYINGYAIYPILIIVILATFLALCFAWYWLLQKIYIMNDDHFELRKARIDLYEKITGKKSKSLREYQD